MWSGAWWCQAPKSQCIEMIFLQMAWTPKHPIEYNIIHVARSLSRDQQLKESHLHESFRHPQGMITSRSLSFTLLPSLRPIADLSSSVSHGDAQHHRLTLSLLSSMDILIEANLKWVRIGASVLGYKQQWYQHCSPDCWEWSSTPKSTWRPCWTLTSTR